MALSVAGAFAIALGSFAMPGIFGYAGIQVHDSLSGNYLAGRVAGRQRDNATAAEYYERALKGDPRNSYIIERAFLLEVSAGRMDRARDLALRLVKLDRKNRFAHLVIGLADFRGGRFARARKHFDISAQGPVGKLTSRLVTAWAYQAGGAVRRGEKALAALGGTDSFRIFRDYHTALVDDVAGRDRSALKHYKSAYEGASGSLRVVENYGSFLERAGKLEEARKIYDGFLESTPNNPIIRAATARMDEGRAPERLIASSEDGAAEALFGIASALADETGIDLALRYVQLALYMRPDFPVAQMLLGNIYEDTKNYASAVEAYGAIPPGSPLRENAELQVAENLDRTGKLDEAVAQLEKIAARDPDNVQPLMVLGNILRVRSKFAQAADAYSRAVKLVPTPTQSDWTLFYFRGIANERTRQWDKAEADFQKALELNPEQPSVLNYLGYSWVERRRNLDQALEMIRKAVELRPNDGYIVDSLGWAQYQLDRFEDAVPFLERAVELRPEDPVINDHLGDAYWRVGRQREARFQWQHARDLNPEEDALKTIVQKIISGLPDAKTDNKTNKAKPDIGANKT